jgi:hypothetical protein
MPARAQAGQPGSPLAGELERISREGVARLRRLASDTQDSLERVPTPRSGRASSPGASSGATVPNPLLLAAQPPPPQTFANPLLSTVPQARRARRLLRMSLQPTCASSILTHARTWRPNKDDLPACLWPGCLGQHGL